MIFAVSLIAAGIAAAEIGDARPAAIARPSLCKLTQSDLAANAKLSFADFDQIGTLPSSARKLGDRSCYAQAADASEHHLIHGPILTDYQRNVVRWHLGQYLASAGREREAARIVSATRREADPLKEGFDWNAYVTGTWAFLVKDRLVLEASRKTLEASSSGSDRMNAKALKRLSRCFDKSYLVAQQSAACASP